MIDQLRSMTEAERAKVAEYLRSVRPKHAVENLLMISSEGILEALARAGSFTIRMIRGVFAEAAFAREVVANMPTPWRSISVAGDPPFDFLLTDQDESANSDVPFPTVRVQVKIQRSKAGKPLLASQVQRQANWPESHFVAEVQKSRKGEKKGKSTRPYRFGEFDVLAVSLGPSRGKWSDFVYTVERWLVPNPLAPDQILKYQPVGPTETVHWTADFEKAVGWLRSGRQDRIDGKFSVPPTAKPRSRPQPRKTSRRRRD